MSTETKKLGFLAAIGSVMNVLPGTDYRSMVDSRSDAEKIGGDWIAVGAHTWMAQERYEPGEARRKKYARKNGTSACH
ncbi:hypothetical protein [Halospina sp. K52047b]|uniref:hypothetical protein n=1 Tax=Halospina sp. K52047b TaxID=2614160 RepID=UPI00124A9743|nr:hypothetical protein [Halospina sp. K52047b]KAA8976921.1 hypothetical protein F3089_15300 [Halospina sp. K52047b]